MAGRRRLGLKAELLLALLPTATVLLVLALVEALSNQRLLFASLASSAFLIYRDPENELNSVRTLLIAQVGSACIGLACYLLLGPGYVSGGVAMVLSIALMIVCDAMHPPGVSTALSFGLRSGDASNLALFCMAVGVTALLVVLQRSALWMVRRLMKR
jgi:CBS-domain-containing membrane protein